MTAGGPERRPPLQQRLTGHPWLALWLVAVWVGLWGSLTAANLLGGIAVAGALLTLLPLPGHQAHGPVRPQALLRFALFFAVELVRASLVVAWQVLHPRRRLRSAVIAVEVPGASDRLLTVLANAISLTPGTLTLDVDRQRAVLYVHVLDVGAGGVDDARRSIAGLQRRAVLAVGSHDAVSALGPVPQGGRR
jgi:multicomponent Na+:H+ antiporter subunit E